MHATGIADTVAVSVASLDTMGFCCSVTFCKSVELPDGWWLVGAS